jgi:hypothetical protein
VDIVYFQETKLEVMSRSVVRSLWGCHHVDQCCLDSRGASGCVLIMWKMVLLCGKWCCSVEDGVVVWKMVHSCLLWCLWR